MLGYLVAWLLVVVWLLVSGMVGGLAPHMSQQARIIFGHAGASVVLLAVLVVLGRFWKSSRLALPTWGRVSHQDWLRGLLGISGLYLMHHLFVLARHQPQEPWMAQVAALSTMDYLLMAVGVATVAPLSEEVMFRQILSRLPSHPAPRIDVRLAVPMFLSCAVFAGLHYSQYQFASTVVLVGAVGVVCMWARWRTGGLALPLVLHGFASLLALAFNALY